MLPFQVPHRLWMLEEAGLIAFSNTCFEFADEGPQKKLITAALRTFRRCLPAIFTDFQRLLLWGSGRRRLLDFSLCCLVEFISASTHARTRAQILSSTRVLGARCQFARSEKHDASHVGGDVTDAGVIVEGSLYGNHCARNLASKIRVSHQPPEVGRPRRVLGTLPPTPVWCGPTWNAKFCVRQCCDPILVPPKETGVH